MTALMVQGVSSWSGKSLITTALAAGVVLVADINRGGAFAHLCGTWGYPTASAQAIRDRVTGGRPLLGICGGLQMLGERVEDDAGVDGSAEGMFESSALVSALLGEQPARSLEQALDELADAIEEHIDLGAVLDTAEVG